MKSEPTTAPPTIAQVAIAQGKNLEMLRTLLEELAGGVLDVATLVGTHTNGITDLRTRLEAVERELGVEMPEAEIEADADDGMLTVLDEGDGDYEGDYDDTVSEFGQHAAEAP